MNSEKRKIKLDGIADIMKSCINEEDSYTQRNSKRSLCNISGVNYASKTMVASYWCYSLSAIFQLMVYVQFIL